jgi:CRP-like cAMP-binding protein
VIVEGEVELHGAGGEVLETIGPGDHFGRKLLEFKNAASARATSLVRTLALREEQANQLQDVFLSTGRIVAKTELHRAIDPAELRAAEDERDSTSRV